MIDLEQVGFIGNKLRRPECVLARGDGTLHVSDWRGGVTVINSKGAMHTVLARGNFRPKPNGIAILREGGWLLAHLGDNDGGVYRLSLDGDLTPFLLEVDNVDLPPTNYVHVDALGRAWVTVSTRPQTRDLGYRANCSDGFIALVDDAGARIVADGLGYTNECHVDPRTNELFVNETFARRLNRFKIDEDGSLSEKTIIAEFSEGEYPDGLTLDASGGIWVTCIISNRVIRVDRSGKKEIILQDSDPDHIAWTEKAYVSNQLGRSHLDNPVGQKLRNISSLAFGGADLKTVYLGCLQGESIATFRTEHAGFPTYHWAL
mgnify:FL=1